MIQLKEGELLSNHTTFRIGGAAKYFAVPKNEEEIMEAVDFAIVKGLPHYILGKGSNVLFPDEGYSGVVIEIGAGMEKVERIGDTGIRAQAGVSLSSLAAFAAREGLAGLEFAGGIPGTLGGAVTMNAGAYGGEMKDVIRQVTVLTPECEQKVLSREELDLSYRHSCIPKNHFLVLEAELSLTPAPEQEIRAKMAELREKRVEKQPLEYPSAGSTFKRPEGYFAGKLIQDSGLKGFTVGGAQVSEKHSGFVINKGNATAADVMELIRQVTAKVKEDTGVTMEPEVKQIGEF